MLVELSIREFSRVLASDAPAPGGGSVAALSGALGADLVAMVCSLSIGNPDYEPFRQELTDTLGRAQGLSKSLLDRVDRDTQAFNGVMAAFKLPKAASSATTSTTMCRRSWRERVTWAGWAKPAMLKKGKSGAG